MTAMQSAKKALIDYVVAQEGLTAEDDVQIRTTILDFHEDDHSWSAVMKTSLHTDKMYSVDYNGRRTSIVAFTESDRARYEDPNVDDKPDHDPEGTYYGVA